jgi:hypothetical protein
MADSMQLDAKAEVYADALIVAISEAAKELGQPDINAALAALAFSQAYLLAKLDLADRLKARETLLQFLDGQTAAFVNERLLGVEPAGQA